MGKSSFSTSKIKKEMVQDGHVSNSYPYSASTYYMDNVKAKHTRGKNNNDNESCVMIVDQKEDTDDETIIVDSDRDRSRSRSRSQPQPQPQPQVNCINERITTTTTTTTTVAPHYVKCNSAANKNTTTSSSPSTTTRYDKMYSQSPSPPPTQTQPQPPDSNGSSHTRGIILERTPSQNLFDVTKETDGGGVHRVAVAVAVERNFPHEFHKTFTAFLILIFNFFLTTTSLAVIHDKVPQFGPLPDTVLGMVEPQEWALVISEIFIIVTTTIMLIIIVLHRHRYIIFRRLFLMLSLLYFMRSITMFVTVLPVSSKTYQCSPRENSTEVTVVLRRSINLFFGMGLTINGKHTYCGDYIYSGHTTVLVMSYLMISEYSPKNKAWLLLRCASWCMSLVGVLMVLLSHSHYTVDVIVGYFVTTRLFWMYHTCANNQFLKKKSRYNYLSREWWFFLFQYFECNVKGPLQPLHHTTAR